MFIKNILRIFLYHQLQLSIINIMHNLLLLIIIISLKENRDNLTVLILESYNNLHCILLRKTLSLTIPTPNHMITITPDLMIIINAQQHSLEKDYTQSTQHKKIKNHHYITILLIDTKALQVNKSSSIHKSHTHHISSSK